MYSVSCRELGGDCDHTVSGETIDEVKQEMWKHADKDHAEMFAQMSEEDKQGLETKLVNFLSAQA